MSTNLSNLQICVPTKIQQKKPLYGITLQVHKSITPTCNTNELGLGSFTFQMKWRGIRYLLLMNNFIIFCFSFR
jgi:hypothetical protein